MSCELPGFRIEPLGGNHSREAFCCGNNVIDKFVRERALKDHQSYKVRVRVASIDDVDHIVGFYSLSLKTLAPKSIGGSIGNKFGKWNIPAVYLSMIGTHQDFKKRHIATELLLHAFQSTLDIADLAGTACLTLDAVDEEMARWYAVRSFKRLPTRTWRP